MPSQNSRASGPAIANPRFRKLTLALAAARRARFLSALAAGALIVLAGGASSVVLADPPPPPTAVQVSFTTNDKPYDGTTNATINTLIDCTLSGVNPADVDNVTCDQTVATASFDSKNAGLETVTGDTLSFSLGGSAAANYYIDSASSSATISQAPLDISATADSRVYNGTANSSAVPTTGLGQVQTGDSVTGLVQTFDSRNAGARTLTVSPGYVVDDGNGGNNYGTPTLHTAAGSISQAPLDISATTDTRGYDGTTTSTVSPTYPAAQVQTGDSVTGLVQAFDSRNAGARTLSVTAYTVNDGNGGNNYAVTPHTAGGTINQASLTVTAVTQVKTADGARSATTIPTVTGTIYSPDSIVGRFSETYDTADAASGKTLTPAGTVSDGNSGLNYSYDYQTVSTGRIRPAAVASLAFTTQPIDTKINTPILNTCAPGGTPCGVGSAPVSVTARDAFGNKAGPNAPGADATNAAILVVIKKDSSSGSIIGPAGGTATNAGVASFGTTLVLSGAFTGHMNLYAFTSAPNTNTLSDDFRIVNDLAPCRGPLCKNSIGNGGTSNTLQYLNGQISANGNYSDTTLTTQFVGANQIDNRCGTSRTLNVGVELRATGPDVAVTKTSYMVMILPKNTLKATGALNRSPGNFDVCLGAIYLGDGTAAHPYGSTHAPWNALGGPATERQDTISVDGDTFYRYWGTPKNCGASGVTASDPCIVLRTKQKADITALINQGVLSAGADANMHDADLAIVIKKPGFWDSKAGIHL